MHPYRNHKLRSKAKEIKCHQCNKVFQVRSFRPEANCPLCNKKHHVPSGMPTPYRKIKYWHKGELVHIPRDLYRCFKTDPQEFGYEIGLRAILLLINPYNVHRGSIRDIKLFEEGKQLGNQERKSSNV